MEDEKEVNENPDVIKKKSVLVRSRDPQIIDQEQQGKFTLREADYPEFCRLLVDIYDVLSILLTETGSSWSEMSAIAKDLRTMRGTYDRGFVMDTETQEAVDG